MIFSSVSIYICKYNNRYLVKTSCSYDSCSYLFKRDNRNFQELQNEKCAHYVLALILNCYFCFLHVNMICYRVYTMFKRDNSNFQVLQNEKMCTLCAGSDSQLVFCFLLHVTMICYRAYTMFKRDNSDFQVSQNEKCAHYVLAVIQLLFRFSTVICYGEYAAVHCLFNHI